VKREKEKKRKLFERALNRSGSKHACLNVKFLSIFLNSVRSDLILDLESSKTLMVEDLTDLSAVEAVVTGHEVDEGNTGNSDEHPGVVSIASGVERIVTELVTVGLVVHVVLFLEAVSVGVAREDVLVAIHKESD